MKIKLNRRYVTRDGRVTNPIAPNAKGIFQYDFPFAESGRHHTENAEWREDGTWLRNRRQDWRDLVAEFIDLPEGIPQPPHPPEGKRWAVTDNGPLTTRSDILRWNAGFLKWQVWTPLMGYFCSPAWLVAVEDVEDTVAESPPSLGKILNDHFKRHKDAIFANQCAVMQKAADEYVAATTPPYRTLDVGETLQEGDEWKCEDEWLTLGPEHIGQVISPDETDRAYPKGFYRRPITSTPESTVPEGFTYFGVGPLKVQNEGKAPNVVIFKSVFHWKGSDNYVGGLPDAHYAIRSNTPLAWQNGLDLPPLPEGYDRWEYRGMGWQAENVTYCSYFESWSQVWENDRTYSGEDHHYIEAIPTPKVEPKTPFCPASAKPPTELECLLTENEALRQMNQECSRLASVAASKVEQLESIRQDQGSQIRLLEAELFNINARLKGYVEQERAMLEHFRAISKLLK